jgi:sugar phosphate isomerase/epimerase
VAIHHVHLKDCRASVLDALPEGAGFVGAVKAGVFCPLGEGDSDIPGAVQRSRPWGTTAGWSWSRTPR